ncbi:inner membrane protein YpjD [Marinicella sp. W31]|uniref:cytochrome C assembly family protein n=1 Tax=Marinicella sp. W31 TaxID=3023713 RepID=UPI0037563675
MKLLIVTAVIAYIAAALSARKEKTHIISTFVGLILHAGITAYLLIGQAGWFFSLQNILLMLSLLVILTLFVSRIRIRLTYWIATAFAVFSLLWVLVLPYSPEYTPLMWESITHILFSLTAYSVLSAASLLAIGLWVQTKRLRHISLNQKPISQNSLLVNQEKLYRMTAIGWLLLSMSLLTGILFVENYLGQQIGHKVVFSLFAWALFGILLMGRFIRGWRGKTIIRLHLIAMILLATGFLGSKIVLEYIL